LSDAAVDSVSGTALLESHVYIGDTVVTVVGVEPAAFVRTSRRLTTVSGSVDDLGDDTVVATRVPPRNTVGKQGELVPLILADGDTARLRVVAILADTSAPAGLLLTRAAVRRHDPSAFDLGGLSPNVPLNRPRSAHG